MVQRLYVVYYRQLSVGQLKRYTNEIIGIIVYHKTDIFEYCEMWYLTKRNFTCLYWHTTRELYLFVLTQDNSYRITLQSHKPFGVISWCNIYFSFGTLMLDHHSIRDNYLFAPSHVSLAGRIHRMIPELWCIMAVARVIFDLRKGQASGTTVETLQWQYASWRLKSPLFASDLQNHFFWLWLVA